MDPLAQLKDVHLPEQIHNYPIAPGWWILAIASTTLIVWLVNHILKRKRFNKQRNQVIDSLNKQDHSNAELIALLKVVAIHYYGREQVANLYGDKLAQFLQQKLPESHQTIFVQMIRDQFSLHYQPTENNEYTLKEAAQYWLKHANLTLSESSNVEGSIQNV